jgi:hypothetical protein
MQVIEVTSASLDIKELCFSRFSQYLAIISGVSPPNEKPGAGGGGGGAVRHAVPGRKIRGQVMTWSHSHFKSRIGQEAPEMHICPLEGRHSHLKRRSEIKQAIIYRTPPIIWGGWEANFRG